MEATMGKGVVVITENGLEVGNECIAIFKNLPNATDAEKHDARIFVEMKEGPFIGRCRIVDMKSHGDFTDNEEYRKMLETKSSDKAYDHVCEFTEYDGPMLVWLKGEEWK